MTYKSKRRVLLQICMLWGCASVMGKETGADSRGEEATGEWGEWGSWSTCTAECRTGMTSRSRRCQHPHMLLVASLLSTGDDSVWCAGSEKEIKLCNKQACGGGRGGWRQVECSKKDGSASGGQTYTWEPFIHPSDPCKLTCRAKGHHFYSNLADRVVDGTPCAGATTNPSAVCVQGRCLEVGCDDIVGSPYRPDECGVCKGDNSTCRKISGIFARQDVSRGVNEIVVIPAGSTRIRVKGLRYSNNWIGLQTEFGEPVLNGGRTKSQDRQLELAGTVFTYRTKRRCAGQCLVARGPTDQTLKLVLNTKGRNRGVMYSFNVPVNVSNGYFRRVLHTSRPRAHLIKAATQRRLHAQHGANSNNNNHISSSTRGRNIVRNNTGPQTVSQRDNTRTIDTGGRQILNDTSSSQTVPVRSNTDSSENDVRGGHVSSENNGLQTLIVNSKEADVDFDKNDKTMGDVVSSEARDTTGSSNVETKSTENESVETSEKSVEKYDSVPTSGKDHFPDQQTSYSFFNSESISTVNNPPVITSQTSHDHSAVVVSDDVNDNNKEEEEAEMSKSETDEDEVGAPEPLLGNPESKKEKTITRKEKPRYVSGNDHTKGTYGQGRRVSELQSNTDTSDHSDELHPSYDSDGHLTTLNTASHTPNDPFTQKTSSSASQVEKLDNLEKDEETEEEEIAEEEEEVVNDEEDEEEETEYEEEEDSSDTMHEERANSPDGVFVSESRQLSRPQSDSPRRRYSAYRARYSRNRPWRRFRRPQYSQSFTFRRRQSQPKPDRTSVSRPPITRPQTPSRQIRYRQQPQRHNSQTGLHASSRSYGQTSSRRNPYSGSGTGNSDTTSQRQALTSGHRVSQEQGSPGQRTIIQPGDSATRRQQVRPSQDTSSAVQKSQRRMEEYRRELARRRQRIEQQIAAQNADYQRRLEERNQRLRQQHLERQQRQHQRHNSSLISRQHSQHRVSTGHTQRQTSPQGNVNGQTSGSESSGSLSSPDHGIREVATEGPGHAASNQPPPQSRQPPASGHDTGDQDLTDRRQPLIISNRRQTHQSVGHGTAPDGFSGRFQGSSNISDSSVAARQPVDQAVQHRPVKPLVRQVSGPTRVDNPDLSPDRRPLVIANRRPGFQQEKTSAPSVAGSSGRLSVPASNTDSRASNRQAGLISSSQRGPTIPGESASGTNAINQDKTNRRWPLIISNRRQDPASKGDPSRPVSPEVGPISGEDVQLGRGLDNPQLGRGLDNPHRPLQTLSPPVVNSARQANIGDSSSAIIPNTASLGGGFVPPQYIPETSGKYQGQPGLSAVSTTNQLAVGIGSGVEVVGAGGLPVSEGGVVVGAGPTGLLEADTPKSYEWRVSGLSDCTLTCGGGIQQTVVVCLDTTTRAFVTDDNCQHVQRPQTKALTCNTRPCPAQWQPSQWSACSVSCGPGEQTRLVACLARISATLNVTMADDNCQTSTKPETRRACENSPCNTWKVGNWSECSVKCGEGVRSRDVYCTDHTGYDVSEDLCSGSGNKPPREEACTMDACGKGWYYTEWPEQCPVRCGAGNKQRGVVCLDREGAVLTDTRCDHASRPLQHQACTARDPCGGEWFSGEWSQCNTSCGPGHQEREVVCMKGLSQGLLSVVQEENCAVADKPELTQPCNQGPCLPEWYMTSWTECSLSCGKGHRTREVKCLESGQRSSSECPVDSKPATGDTCNTQPCVTTPSPAATHPAGSSCRDSFSRCQLVKHARMCRYAYYRKKCCLTCSGDT